MTSPTWLLCGGRGSIYCDGTHHECRVRVDRLSDGLLDLLYGRLFWMRWRARPRPASVSYCDFGISTGGWSCSAPPMSGRCPLSCWRLINVACCPDLFTSTA